MFTSKQSYCLLFIICFLMLLCYCQLISKMRVVQQQKIKKSGISSKLKVLLEVRNSKKVTVNVKITCLFSRQQKMMHILLSGVKQTM